MGEIKATFVKDMSNKFSGTAMLWELSEPIGYRHNWDDGEPTEFTDHVVTSAAITSLAGPETYVFPADQDGNILDWGEIAGSFRGGLDHHEAIRRSGWSIGEDPS